MDRNIHPLRGWRDSKSQKLFHVHPHISNKLFGCVCAKQLNTNSYKANVIICPCRKFTAWIVKSNINRGCIYFHFGISAKFIISISNISNTSCKARSLRKYYRKFSTSTQYIRICIITFYTSKYNFETIGKFNTPQFFCINIWTYKIFNAFAILLSTPPFLH